MEEDMDYPDIALLLINMEMKIMTHRDELETMRKQEPPNDEAVNDMLDKIGKIQLTVVNLQESLRIKRNEIEQEKMASIEVAGIPDGMAENTADIADVLTRVLKIEIQEDKVKSFEIDDATHSYSRFLEPSTSHPAQILVVHLSDREIYEQIMTVALIAPLQLQVGENMHKVSICGHLTFMNKQILRKTQIEAARHGIGSVWVDNGKIYVRRNEESEVHQIRGAADVDKMEKY